MQASNGISSDVPNPDDMFALTEEQQKITIVGKWENVNSVEVTVTVATGDNFSRFVLFGGAYHPKCSQYRSCF